MKKIEIGFELKDKCQKFRETCFGIVKTNNKFLCVLKDDTYSLIGGGIEQNESELDCLKREFLEEAGREIKSANKICIVDIYWKTRDNFIMHSLSNIYDVSITSKQLEILEKEHTVVELTMEELLTKLPLPYQKKGVEVYLNNLTNR